MEEKALIFTAFVGQIYKPEVLYRASSVLHQRHDHLKHSRTSLRYAEYCVFVSDLETNIFNQIKCLHVFLFVPWLHLFTSVPWLSVLPYVPWLHVLIISCFRYNDWYGMVRGSAVYNYIV